MKALGWIFAGVGIGLVTYVVLNQPGPEYATGNDDVEDAAGRASLWGSKQRSPAPADPFFGKVKEGVGRATGDQDLEAEGLGDQVIGAVKNTAGDAAHAVGETLHELNR